MKTRYQMSRPLGDLIEKAVNERPLIPSKNWSQFDDIEATFYARQRPAPAPAPAPVPIAVTLQPVETLETRFPLPFSPPRYEKGKEVIRWIPCMKVTCGNLSYRIIKKTDGGRVMSIANKMKRLATPSTLESFIQEALEYIDEKPTTPTRPAPEWSDPASGVSVKQRKGANLAETGLPVFEYCNAEQAEKAIHQSATLADSFAAAAKMRKVFTTRRRKAA